MGCSMDNRGCFYRDWGWIYQLLGPKCRVAGPIQMCRQARVGLQTLHSGPLDAKRGRKRVGPLHRCWSSARERLEIAFGDHDPTDAVGGERFEAVHAYW